MSTDFGFTRADFPPGFEFGTATSSYQIEGHRVGGAGLTHWDTFAATPGNVVNRENGDLACDHYHRWAEDLDFVAQAGLGAYRFSTSWARIMPDGRTVNPDGLDFYDRLVDGMLSRDIRPYATLYHWELPVALADHGGWTNRETADRFAEFARVVTGRLGDRLAAVAPINEPWCVAWLSHFEGHHAPGLRDIRAAARAMHHVMLAHGQAVSAMRAEGQGNIGIVVNMEFAEPGDETEEAATAAETYDAIYNRWFLGGVFRRAYPAQALAGLEPHLPEGWADDFDAIAAPIDWVGLNYYTRKLLVDDGTGAFPGYAPVQGPLDTTTMGWEIRPEGLGTLLRRIHEEYTPTLPIYVTENGMSAGDMPEGGVVDDLERIMYLEAHLAEIRSAIEAGVPVKGYFIWSLLDNYEWALGYEKRFGLVHVDFGTLARTPKRSWHALRTALTP
ncbi:MAG: GH1 family beta-glucosidase [Pseudomonadota bacterium]